MVAAAAVAAAIINKQQHHNPNRPPNRNQIFDSSGPDVRVRGNAHQVFDKYQALAREAAASGDRILAEAYWQYADHYFRMIQTMGGFGQRNNQGWGDGGEEGQAAIRSSRARPRRSLSRPTAMASNAERPSGSGRARGAAASETWRSRARPGRCRFPAEWAQRADRATIRRPTSSPRYRSSRRRSRPPRRLNRLGR